MLNGGRIRIKKGICMGKKNILLSIFVLLVCIIFLVIGIFVIYKPKFYIGETPKVEGETELGELHYEEAEEDELPTYSEEEADPTEFVPVINLIGVYDYNFTDIFTIAALEQMPQAIRDYLDAHGYADVYNLTIIGDSIVAERGYPMFQCTMEETDKILEVRYELAKKEFEFTIK